MPTASTIPAVPRSPPGLSDRGPQPVHAVYDADLQWVYAREVGSVRRVRSVRLRTAGVRDFPKKRDGLFEACGPDAAVARRSPGEAAVGVALGQAESNSYVLLDPVVGRNAGWSGLRG